MTRASKQRNRAGLPGMSELMQTILQQLRTAKQQACPFVCLAHIHARTLRAMERHDWMVRADKGAGKGCYTITGRGLAALAVYETPSKYRCDGLCPDCGVNPKHVSASGKQFGYCTECYRVRSNEKYREKGHQYRADALCPDCGERPRMVCSTGFVKPYCQECVKRRMKEERARKYARKLARIQAGEFIACSCCKTRPVYVSGSAVYDYCYACYRQKQNTWNKRWKLANVLAKTDAADD